MTKLKAIEARARIQPGPGWPDWVHRTDDDRHWLLARVKELAAVIRPAASINIAVDMRSASDTDIGTVMLVGWHQKARAALDALDKP